MDRDSKNRRSCPSTSGSSIRIREELALPSQEREYAASGSDASFRPNVPAASFSFGSAPGTSYSQNALISFGSSSGDDIFQFNSPLNLLTDQEQTSGSSHSFNQRMQGSISGMQQYAQSSPYHPHQTPDVANNVPNYDSGFQDPSTSKDSAGASGSGKVLDSAISANPTTGVLSTHHFLNEARFLAGLANSSSDSQLLETPGEPLGLSPATGNGSELNFTPTAEPPGKPIGLSLALATGDGSGLNYTLSASSSHDPHGIGAGVDIFALADSGVGVSQTIHDPKIYDTAPLRSAQDWRITAFRGGPELSLKPTASSRRDPRRLGAGVGFRPLTDTASGMSQSTYDPMTYNAAPSYATQDVRQTALIQSQPQSVNYGQQYPRANYGTSIVRGQADSSRNLPLPFQDHLVSPSVPIINNQAGLYGFMQYARPGLPSPFSMNLHGTVQTASHGMPRYNPQTGLYLSPSMSTMTSYPAFSRLAAVPRQNQPGQHLGSQQVRLHPNFYGGVSPDQLQSAVGRHGLSPSSHVHSSFHKRPAQDYPYPNIDENQGRTRPRPFISIPLVQSEASPPTQVLVNPSLSHSRQTAPGFPIPAQTAQPVHSGTESILPRVTTQARPSRPLSVKAQSYVPLAQRSTAASSSRRCVARKNPSWLRGAKVASHSSPAMERAISLLDLPAAPSSTDRIRWKGEEHQLVGHNCYFCKRDLSYPPEGPIIENPELLPTVSILPCGHAFHDFCLQQITPPDEANDPPCIPCAIGEEP